MLSQKVDRTAIGNEPHVAEDLREARGFGGDDHVARERHGPADAGHRPAHGCHDRLFDVREIAHHAKRNLIGEVGKGWTYIGEHLELERLSLAASYVGNARTALDDTIRYTKERKQFGRSLSSFQVLKHRMAENECEIEGARLLTYAAATRLPEFDMERYFGEAKHAMVGGGTNEIQRSIIAKEMGL